MLKVWTSLVLVLLSATVVGAQTFPVVPGGFGYGMNTRAAYACSPTNPTVIKVTSLSDSGTGTLRAALEASGPRVVVFETSGNIDLASAIHITNPCITVAGQTAPSPGITVRYYEIEVRTHDVLLQHFRIRPGWTGANCNEGLGLYSVGGVPAYNVVFDHMSNSWGLDENVYVIAYGQADFTFWRSITSESLNQTPNTAFCSGQNEPGHGFLAYDSSTHVDMIQSLTAHNLQRNPYYENGTTGRVLNNVIYDWYKEWGIAMTSASNLAQVPVYLSAAGNRLIRGPNTVNAGDGDYAWAVFLGTDNNEAGNKIYLADNTVTNDPDNKVVAIHNDFSYNPVVGSPPAEAPLPSGYPMIASTAVEAQVLPNVGARPLDRDSVDTRLIAEVTNRTQAGSWYPQTQADVGGWPTLAVNNLTFNIPANPNTVQASGYTTLEEYLHVFAAMIEPDGSGPIIPGTRIPTATSILDSYGYTWTLASDASCTAPFLAAKINGTLAGACGSMLLLYNSGIYIKEANLNWYLYDGSAWGLIGPNDPETGGLGESATCTRIFSSVSSITDASMVAWTMGGGTSPNIQILQNGVNTLSGLGSQVLYFGGTIYVKGDDALWYVWGSSTYTLNGNGLTDPGLTCNAATSLLSHWWLKF